jgi:hypothetical protein
MSGAILVRVEVRRDPGRATLRRGKSPMPQGDPRRAVDIPLGALRTSQKAVSPPGRGAGTPLVVIVCNLLLVVDV